MSSKKICIIGLGYVGLPLAIELGKKYDTIGYDQDKKRIINLKKKKDFNNQIKKIEFSKSRKIKFSYKHDDIRFCNIYIIAVPTPVNYKNNPDLNNLIAATKLVARFLKPKDLVIYESTVYPGTTEEICVPILKKISKLKTDVESKRNSFSYGFSPERLNPGSKQNDIRKITKVTSGSTNKSLAKINYLYKSIIKAGTFMAANVKIAEAAKIIENTQRDVNIALINEFQKIFHKMNLNIYDILRASKTKWNFLNFSPGLVGGHCISVDPYYLSFKAKQIGINPKMVLSGRDTNKNMPRFYCKSILNSFSNSKKLKILILGLTFKENCPDIRNSGSLEMIKILRRKKNIYLHSYDPNVSKKDIKYLKNFNYVKKLKKNFYDIIVVTVAHNKFRYLTENYFKKLLKKKNGKVFDLKNILNKSVSRDFI